MKSGGSPPTHKNPRGLDLTATSLGVFDGTLRPYSPQGSVCSVNMKILFLSVAWVLALGLSMSSASAESGHAMAHDGSEIYFEVHGEGERFLFLGPGTAAPRAMSAGPGQRPLAEVSETLAQAKQAYIDAFGEEYRLIFIEYPGIEPKMYTLTPSAVARDYLAIADAAGATEFAYAGFSWGCVTGLQLALRTDRMTALVCGGYPAMDGVYEDMRKVCRAMSEGPASLYGLEVGFPESGRQFLTYYEGLQSFNDRLVQGALKIPRLNWIGDQDLPTLNGEPLTHMGEVIINNRDELEAAGWDVKILPGRNHLDGGAPDVQVQVIDEWLSKVLP